VYLARCGHLTSYTSAFFGFLRKVSAHMCIVVQCVFLIDTTSV